MVGRFTARVWQEGEWHVARCREVGVTRQGRSAAEAMENLAGALLLYLSPPGVRAFAETPEPEAEAVAGGAAAPPRSAADAAGRRPVLGP